MTKTLLKAACDWRLDTQGGPLAYVYPQYQAVVPVALVSGRYVTIID